MTIDPKHTPIIEVNNNTVKVIVGEIIHPMSEAHAIEWIELEVDGKIISRKILKSTDSPIVEFSLPENSKIIIAREHCNLHGTWETKKEI